MNRVKRAIIMAAGKGTRLYPLTKETPKPLIKVKGVPMIESILQGLISQGIHEFYVVVGYKKEQFSYLEKMYSGLHLIENPYYESCNNISSLYVAREYLQEAMIIDGDQIVWDSEALAVEFERSGYNAVWNEEETKEWLMQVDSHGIVKSCSRTGGREGYQLYGISRWTWEDGAKLRKHLEYEFEEKKNRDIYWDDVAMFCHFEEYELGIFSMKKGAVQEIDSLEELYQVENSEGVSDYEGK